MYGGGRGVVNVMFVRRYSVWRWAWCSEHVCEEVQCMGRAWCMNVMFVRRYSVWRRAWCSEPVFEVVQCMEVGVVL